MSEKQVAKEELLQKRSSALGSIARALAILLPLRRAPYIKKTTLGCYQMVEEVQPWTVQLPTSWLNAFTDAQEFLQNWKYIVRFVKECWTVAGGMQLCLLVLFRFVLSMSNAVSLYLTGALMSSLEALLLDRAQDPHTLYRAVAALLLWKVTLAYVRHVESYRVSAVARRRIDEHFAFHMLKARLRLDVPTFNDPEVKARFARVGSHFGQSEPFNILFNVLHAITHSISIVTEIFILFQFLRKEEHGLSFTALAAARPLINIIANFSQQPRSFYIYLANSALEHFNFLNTLGSAPHHKHAVADGLQDFTVEEVAKHRKELLGLNTEDPWTLLDGGGAPDLMSYLSSVSSDIPLALYSLYTLKYSPNQQHPFKLFTILSTSATSLSDGVESLIFLIWRTSGFHSKLRDLYELAEIPNTVKDGDRAYPTDFDEKGMKIEFRSVSFSYPGETKKKILQDMSFVLEPGQLCVIVGENGCGKSSTVSLINRIYEPSEGTILIDDTPVEEYKIKDLREAQAVLHQEWARYRTTISDNIGFGSPAHRSNESLVQQAAEAAGASEWIDKLPKQAQTKTEGQAPIYSSFKPDSTIATYMKEDLDRKVEASGGQWQRLAIARSLMRTLSDTEGNVRLMCYDEPSSALDPKAEFALFEKLRKERGGRTLIFITHRFGHLTKYADLILYMKEGRIEEAGSHEELLKLDGNYAQLYNVQAQAFT